MAVDNAERGAQWLGGTATRRAPSMQVPAPFDYERATSVDHAIGLLARLGTTARLVAGGHSLLPMMKLRLANFEYLIDINDLHGELGYVRVEPTQIRIGAMTRHRELLESAELLRSFPIFHDAERRHRRPARAQPGHDRRCAVPGRPVRGPLRGVHDPGRQLRDPRPRRRAGRAAWPSSTAARTRRRSATPRCSPRSASRCGRTAPARTRRSAGGPATGPSSPAGWPSGWTTGVITDARVGLAAVGPNTTGIPAISRALRGRPPSEELYAEAGAIAAEHCTPVTDQRGSAEYKRHLAGRADPPGAAPRGRPRRSTATPGELTHAGDDDGQRRAR